MKAIKAYKQSKKSFDKEIDRIVEDILHSIEILSNKGIFVYDTTAHCDHYAEVVKRIGMYGYSIVTEPGGFIDGFGSTTVFIRISWYMDEEKKKTPREATTDYWERNSVGNAGLTNK